MRRVGTSFASLPDRGELLAYDHVRRAKQSGAYTAYPVTLSEEHALRAMRSGELVVNAPNGEQIRLKFERHVEHPDGNWTWIGRNANGADAVLTFGEKAVFGSIPQGAADTLRLTMRAGQSYLVTTDRSRLRGADGVLRRSGTDALIPPKLAASSDPGPTAASLDAEPVTASATAVVDVLLGYSNGFASQLGGVSQANTRLVNMIDITNQAYANSGVSMRVRLVGTLQVNYVDNTDNGDVLEKLTGYKSGSGAITPDPAFNDLRALRESRGADLVSLVRAFRTPENDGCGIAWLIGGDQSAFTTGSAPFGYSVVSDGTDLDEGDNKTYFCREETLAHEFGHNMGQAHNSEIAENPGVHAYSYGYREASTTGFYTIMAYRLKDSSQFSIRHFANPGVNYAGRLTGIANAADTVRSMNQTMPIVAGFRGTVVPDPDPVSEPVLDVATHDFDGDGVSDVLWRNFGTGANTIWRKAEINNQQTMTGVGNLAWEMVGVGDFNADGKDDVLWRNSSNGANTIWRSGNAATVQAVSGVSSQAWQVVGVGDFDGDGTDDVLWRHAATGANTIWRSANRATQTAMVTISDTNWTVVGVGDFNADGKSDILWRHMGSGSGVIWFSGSYATRQSITRISSLSWQIVGVGDFNQDGVADILWRNNSTGGNVIWRSGDYGDQQRVRSVSNQDWKIEATGDYDADGTSDVLWRNDVTGSNVIWRGGDASQTQAMGRVRNLYWQVQP